MSEIEALVRMAVLALLAVSGLVRVIAALFVPTVRQSIARHRTAHACWFAVSAIVFLFLLRLFFPTRELIRLSSAANQPPAGKAGMARPLAIELSYAARARAPGKRVKGE